MEVAKLLDEAGAQELRLMVFTRLDWIDKVYPPVKSRENSSAGQCHSFVE